MELEERIARSLAEGDLARAATETVDGYGPEVLGFLIAMLGDRDEACEAFAQASEDLWSGLRGFKQRSSMRTWFYAVARHAALRLRRSPLANPARRARVSQAGALAASVRRSTEQYLRTEVKDGFAALRASLEPEDRTLLVLRVDRQMSWDEIAGVMAAADAPDTDAERKRAAARLRKRFQIVKDEIRKRARAAGLLPED